MSPACDLRAGNDPRPPKAAPVARELTFGSLVDDWARLGIARRSRRYREDSPRAIRRNFPDLLEKPADSITKADTVNILDRIAHKPGEQDKARRCAERVLWLGAETRQSRCQSIRRLTRHVRPRRARACARCGGSAGDLGRGWHPAYPFRPLYFKMSRADLAEGARRSPACCGASSTWISVCGLSPAPG